jgi:cell division protein FtsW
MSAATMALSQGLARPRRLEVDPLLLGAVVGLLMLGVIMVASASMSISEQEFGSPFHYLIRHSLNIGLGLFMAVMVLGIPVVIWQRTSFLLLLLAMGMLIMVLVPGVARPVNGAVRWLQLGVFNLQVSEPARLLLMMYLSAYMVRRGDELRESFGGFIKPMLVIALACFLLLLEPDFGATMVLLSTSLAMLFIAGVNIRYFLLLITIAAAAMAGLALTSEYRVRRLMSFIDPWADPFGSGFQLTQSLIAIGRGEWMGVGLGSGIQKLFYLPEAHTDFVFAVMAEELGLFGVLCTLGLYLLLVWRAFKIATNAARADLMFGAYLAFGIGFWMGFQALINIGVNMGALPTKGLTLPLMSYGGSSILITLIALAVLFRVNHETQAVGRSAVVTPAAGGRGRPGRRRSA